MMAAQEVGAAAVRRGVHWRRGEPAGDPGVRLLLVPACEDGPEEEAAEEVTTHCEHWL